MKKVIGLFDSVSDDWRNVVFATLAGDTHHTRSFTISEPMIVGGVMVEEGEYRIRLTR